MQKKLKKKILKKIQIILFAYEMQKKKLKKIQYIYLICIRNAKKETKSYLHKKVTKINSKSSNLHMKCKKKLKKKS
jgi:hypothetical protein